MTRFRLLAPAVALTGVGLLASPASAAAPETFGPFVDTYSFVVDCGAFDAEVSGTVTTTFRVFTDAEGTLTRFQQHVLAPTDTRVNSETGERVPGTDQFTLTVVGFRYLVNQPGSGVIVQEVGRIVYEDPSEETILSMAGQHDLAHWSAIEPTFCGALA